MGLFDLSTANEIFLKNTCAFIVIVNDMCSTRSFK